jgi:hypothetical protein
MNMEAAMARAPSLDTWGACEWRNCLRSDGPRVRSEVVVGHAFDIAQPHRQRRLGAFQRLNPRLFIRAQHQRLVRRIEVEPGDAGQLLLGPRGRG